MNDRISALMDGELGRHETAGTLEAVKSGGDARETWQTYHLIGDAMRETRVLSAGFSGRVSARLDGEPTVLAPSRLAARPAAMRWSALAAGVAAVVFVGWTAFAPQEGQGPASRVAGTAPVPAASVQGASLVAPALVPPPASADDYLLAHQGYSPRNSLQGAAPYVRTVSGGAGAQRR